VHFADFEDCYFLDNRYSWAGSGANISGGESYPPAQRVQI